MKKYIMYGVVYFSGVFTTILIIIIFKLSMYFFFPSPMNALPFSATGIHIKRYINGFLPDYSYELKATVSKEGFKAFIKRLGLDKHYNPEKKIYQEEKREYHWSREAYYKDGILYYSEGQS